VLSPVLAQLPVDDWDQAAIEAAVLDQVPLDLDAVPVLGEDVLLVAAEPADGTYYLLVDGTVEYVVDAAEDAGWLALLRGLDGRRTLRELLGDRPPAEVEQVLREAVDLGVVQLQVLDRIPEPA
jgi:asparagine synthase (glutamine-hydrolysing)